MLQLLQYILLHYITHVISAFLAACGGESKKKFVGTPHPGKGLRSMCSFLRNKKADKTFVDRDEVASKLRGTTHFEPAWRDIAHDEVRHIRLCLSSTWFVR